MKKTIALLFVTFVMHSLLITAQTPNWQWAKSAGGVSEDNGRGCCTDAGGNVFVTGSFWSPTITFGTTVLTNAGGGNSDMFIVKYDAGGNVLWAKRAGGVLVEGGLGCCTDAGGNIFVTGSFESPILTFGTTVITNAGIYDMFIVKYDAGGNVLWAKSAGGTSTDHGQGCSTDAGGNIFVTGRFQSPTLSFGTTVLTNAGIYDMFIVKYDAGGNVLWAKRAGGVLVEGGQGCSTDAGGNIFVTGSFESPILTFGTTVITNAGIYDMFIVKYDAGGNVLWAKSAGGTSTDHGQGCSTDAGGNIFVTGSFESPILTFGTTVLTNAGSWEDMFIVKYDAGGNVLWAKSASGGWVDYGQGCSTDAGGNVFVTGYFQSPTITFGTTVLTNAGSNAGSYDMFIVKYDAGGNVLWAQSAGGTSGDYGQGCSTDAGGNIFVTGYFNSSTLSFGTTVLTNTGDTTTHDMFLAKLDGVTGINELSGEESFSVFPNPTSGKFTIKNEGVMIERCEVKIYNVFGERIYQLTDPLIYQSTAIDISSQPSGIYFLNIKTEQGTINQKLIISK